MKCWGFRERNLCLIDPPAHQKGHWRWQVESERHCYLLKKPCYDMTDSAYAYFKLLTDHPSLDLDDDVQAGMIFELGVAIILAEKVSDMFVYYKSRKREI
jgi:hypothetical protein